MRHPLLTALPVCLLLATTACSPSTSSGTNAPAPAPTASASDQVTSSSAAPTSTPESSDPTSTPEPSGPTLAIRIEGDKVSPNAQRISVEAGEPITITFTTDRPGELHVHSKPEQYVEFTQGSTKARLVIDTPGLVEVEEHDTSAVVAQIEVR